MFMTPIIILLQLAIITPLFVNSQFQGYIQHFSSGKLIHPQGGDCQATSGTRLVIYEGHYGEQRVRNVFEEAAGEGGYGYIKHSCSGNYVHPEGGQEDSPENTPLVYHAGKHDACLFKFDNRNRYIIHKGTGMIWHPLSGTDIPDDNTFVVLRRSTSQSFAKFHLVDASALFNIVITPIGYIVHTRSGKLIHPYGGRAHPSENTQLVTYQGGMGESRLQVTFELLQNGGHLIRHVSSGKYIMPLSRSTQPTDDTHLVLRFEKHVSGLFYFDHENKLIVHTMSNKAFRPLHGSVNPGNNEIVVLHSTKDDSAKFHFMDLGGGKVSPV